MKSVILHLYKINIRWQWNPRGLTIGISRKRYIKFLRFYFWFELLLRPFLEVSWIKLSNWPNILILRPKYFNITISQTHYKLFLLKLSTWLFLDRLFSSVWICQLSSKLTIGMTLMNSPQSWSLFSSRMFISAFHEKIKLTSYPFLVCQFYINSLSFLTLFLPNTNHLSYDFITAWVFFLVRKGKLLVTIQFWTLVIFLLYLF